MNKLRKVLVVDDGARTPEYALSGELAELGFASVTTSVEALDDVLAMTSPLAAILVQLPEGRQSARKQQFIEVAERLRTEGQISGIPVVVLDRATARAAGGYASALQSSFGAAALSQPDF
jgi:CheY-like chemotaxis protein